MGSERQQGNQTGLDKWTDGGRQAEELPTPPKKIPRGSERDTQNRDREMERSRKGSLGTEEGHA